MRRKKEKESDIQLEIFRYLRSQGHLFWRFSPDTYIPTLGRYVKHEYIPSGLADIMVLHKRAFIGLEVKKKRGRPSADQLLMQKRFQSLGHDQAGLGPELQGRPHVPGLHDTVLDMDRAAGQTGIVGDNPPP